MLVCSSEHKTLKLNAQEKRTSLYDCLYNFTKEEVLEDNNKWYCNRCKEHVRASKQMEIYKSNQILVLAFKRFSRGFKVKDSVDFPIEGLDVGPYIKSNLYSMQAIKTKSQYCMICTGLLTTTGRCQEGTTPHTAKIFSPMNGMSSTIAEFLK